MQWVRNISVVKRVVAGLSVMGTLFGVTSGAAAWALAHHANALNEWGVASGRALPDGLQAAQTAASQMSWSFATLGVVGLIVALAAAWVISASIKASVEDTVQCVVRIASGDLETKVESPGRDEISWLRAELNGMRKKLRKTVLEVQETAQIVNGATAEIASGNMDLSTRTEGQASALEQTLASIRQMAETVRNNAISTQEARTVVAQSSSVAGRGAQTMQDVIARMAEINSSSTRITEIIGVIDGIAFQTNILALNAAVEAARAGEHGRGFAVVASEVRGLAQRSSLAAREIKDLISDSRGKVEAGAALVSDAGETMKEIHDSVAKASVLITRIATAGESQSSDISQVSQAMVQIDGMTQQNAALVEQLAASAQSLRGQSDRLNASMSSFRVVPG